MIPILLWCHRFRCVNSLMFFFAVSMVSRFCRFRGVDVFMVLYISWCQWFHGFVGFVVSRVSWFHRFRGVNGFMVSLVSWCQWFHSFIGFVVSMVSWF